MRNNIIKIVLTVFSLSLATHAIAGGGKKGDPKKPPTPNPILEFPLPIVKSGE